jgi:hypothetical protein
MAALITVAIVMGVACILLGTYLKICWDIQHGRRVRSLWFGAPSHSARSLVGTGNPKWH